MRKNVLLQQFTSHFGPFNLPVSQFNSNIYLYFIANIKLKITIKYQKYKTENRMFVKNLIYYKLNKLYI